MELIPELGIYVAPHLAALYRQYPDELRRRWSINPPPHERSGEARSPVVPEPRGLPLVDCRECEHFGDEIGHDERVKLGLKHTRVWHRCELGYDPICQCNTRRRCAKLVRTNQQEAE